jgi:hypothetical protein
VVLGEAGERSFNGKDVLLKHTNEQEGLFSS